MEVLKLILFSTVSLCLMKLVCASVAPVEHGEVSLFDAGAEFDVDTTVLLNDAARSDKEVGYKLRATLTVQPYWTDHQTNYLLQFQLKSPKLLLRGKHMNAEFLPKPSIWDSHQHSTFYANWNHGLIETAYLDPADQLDILNYKKSLISLFQFQMLDVDHNETDISGTCETSYESLSLSVIRKVKRRCIWLGSETEEREELQSRRMTRYELAERGEGGLRGVYAEELHSVQAGALQGLALKARAWHSLTHAAATPTTPPHATLLQDALQSLPAALKPLPLVMEPTDPEPEDDMELPDAVEAHRAALQSDEAGQGGGAAQAHAVLDLLPLLRAARHDELLRLLEDDANHDILLPLCRLVGVAGSAAGLAAARGALQLSSREVLLAPALHYLAGLALAPNPEEAVVAEVVRLGVEGKVEAVREAAALAGASAARDGAGAREVREALVKSLARCKDEACRVNRLQALGNLGSSESADLLLQHGTAAAGDAAALAALRALEALPARAVTFPRVRRLLSAALLTRRLEARAAALDLAVRRARRAPAALHEPAHALHASAPPELRRVFWQRLHALARRHALVRDTLSMFHPKLLTWDARALAGTSSVLALDLGLREWGWSGALESVQVASGGVLRRGRVTLLARREGREEEEEDVPALELELWTRGLESFAGDAAAAQDEEVEDTAAGLSLSVLGSRFPPVTLFESQMGDEMSKRKKFLFVTWVGPDVSVIKRAKMSTDKAIIKDIISNFAVELQLESQAEIDIDQFKEALNRAGGANYGTGIRDL